jgi:Skp family chaperone for outer membrane proteins
MNKRLLLALIVASIATTGCASKSDAGSSAIGLIDVPRITANWPKFLNYQNQLNADAATIQQSHAPDAQKQRQLAALQARFQTGQTELTDDVRNAAQQVATDKHLRFVLTQQYVGYGGVDITSDVEKILNITERATPAP